MNLLFTPLAWEEYLLWQANDPDGLARLNALIADARRDPFRGLGKPEPLRENLSGWWSRRITREHRLVYRCIGIGEQKRLEIAQCHGHY